MGATSACPACVGGTPDVRVSEPLFERFSYPARAVPAPGGTLRLRSGWAALAHATKVFVVSVPLRRGVPWHSRSSSAAPPAFSLDRSPWRRPAILWGQQDHGVENTFPLMHREHRGEEIQRKRVVSCEPAKLGFGEERPESLTYLVPVSFERPAHERSEEVPVLRSHERRTALGGHHEASVDLRLRTKGVRR